MPKKTESEDRSEFFNKTSQNSKKIERGDPLVEKEVAQCWKKLKQNPLVYSVMYFTRIKGKTFLV